MFHKALFLLAVVCSSVSWAMPFKHQLTDTVYKDDASVGRYIYLGSIPEFKSDDLELYVSKIALTLRVKGWVSQDMVDRYGHFLITRWGKIHNAFEQDKMAFLPLASLTDMSKEADRDIDQKWLPVVWTYMKHVLEGQGTDIYRFDDRLSYNEEISLSILRYFLQDKSLGFEDGLKLLASAQALGAESWSKDPVNQEFSRKLFEAHLGSLFTTDLSGGLAKGPGYAGFVTIVYPIAAITAGPFSIPAEGTYRTMPSGSVDARIHSDKWQDAYGGFPFLLFTNNEVAFHGPITTRTTVDIWYLQRDFVSHGCHRMDPNDIMELRAMLPVTVTRENSIKGVRVYVSEGPDVTDWNNDGTLEVMDSSYYSMSTIAAQKEADVGPASFIGKEGQQRWWKGHFVNLPASKLPKGYAFDPEKGEFKNIVKYDFSSGKLKRVGTHPGPITIWPMEFRGTRIIQYREAGVKLSGYDDRNGQYPPRYFK